MTQTIIQFLASFLMGIPLGMGLIYLLIKARGSQ